MKKNNKWLKFTRKKTGLSQQELADKTGLSKSTIESLEQGKRTGSITTWEKLMNFFDSGLGAKISRDSEELIEELKEDIEEFGEDDTCYVFYKETDNSLIFTNYDFAEEEDPIKKEELEDDEYLLKTTLGDALKLFEKQNDIL